MHEILRGARFRDSYVPGTGNEGVKKLYGRSSNYTRGWRLMEKIKRGGGVKAHGEGKMPASGKNLSEQEQADVLAYVRSLAK